jgi:hypothetical protein
LWLAAWQAAMIRTQQIAGDILKRALRQYVYKAGIRMVIVDHTTSNTGDPIKQLIVCGLNDDAAESLVVP